ncbi:glycoside hydrolase family 88/105 protein [Treponema brennaborense]|uniref:Glycosyl hydrolase family 88 n=1 Tax=Treponema brennaborense (strain DSM 12168 / CIP 105900 / DD5/3) TaxID=906968 RepID=F4LJ76_TREBD|nr:glycoside hydrolase family 88 protein [Treponema brennaborense]AEE16333.1 glycosyl hydrolase family 88 [Treponema brennaborense DSM 12168]
MNTTVIENYVSQLMERSTAEIPAWNIEKKRSGSKSGWDYIDGCMILAILELYDADGNAAYLKFADQYEDYRVRDDGSITGYEMGAYNLDDINGAKNFFTLFRLTGKLKYRRALDTVYAQIKTQPRTKEGNFWHKKIYPDQIWLDGLYMAQPFYMEYEAVCNECRCIKDIYSQFFTVERLMRDGKTGLYYHGYDSSRRSFWCDKETGLSANFWLRALGWFSMALLDTLDKAPDKGSADHIRLGRIFTDLMETMLRYQDGSGMWFQIPDQGGREKNYLETSGSAIMAYCMMKGTRLGILSDGYRDAGRRALDGICNTYLITENGEMSLGGICLVAGLGPENNRRRDGSYEYYMSEPVVRDDAKGVGPFLLAFTEWKRLHE